MPVINERPVFTNPTEILAVDYGSVRVGIARVNSYVRLPEALAILKNNEELFDNIAKLIDANKSQLIVVGLPRNLSGQETEQSQICRQFAEDLSQKIAINVYLHDETLTSVQAEKTNIRGTSELYKDDVAACLILKDLLESF